FNNTFLNALGHNLHLYYMLENVDVYDNTFIIDEIKPFKPDTLETARIKNQPITVGHEVYQENHIKNIEIKNNYMVNKLLDYQDKTNNGISLLTTLENVTVKNNTIINFYGGIISTGMVHKALVISDNNILNYGYGGIMLRPVK